MKQTFPKDFLWGAATSAHQIEGGNTNNDWYVCEEVGADRSVRPPADRTVAGPPSTPTVNGPASTSLGGTTHRSSPTTKNTVPVCGLSCDSYNRYEEDFDLAVSLGHNAHRLSIEWSRIEPVEGQFSQEAVEHYRQVLTALRRRGLTSFVTLWHFTLPAWVSEMGGWENRKTVDYFCRYVKFCAENFGDLVDFWITLNEPFNIYAPLTRLNGAWPPFKKGALISFIRVTKHLLEAHKRSYRILKAVTPQTPVGLSENLAYFKPRNPRWLGDIVFARLCQFVTLDLPLLLLSKHLDYIGVNQYFSYEVTSLRLSIAPLGDGVVKSDLGWKLNPPAMYLILSKLKKYNLPIYITENGVADASDTLRQNFIKDTLGWVGKALSEGVDVRGYLHWSLIDNYEWCDGYKGRFGLVAVDFEDNCRREVRQSALWLKDFIRKSQNRIEGLDSRI